MTTTKTTTTTTTSDPLPSYDPNEPARLQENDWDCSVESMEWCLYAWGRTPDDNWIENSMIAAGVVDPAIGLCDASGAGLAAWANDEYGEFGYVASNEPSVTFDAVAGEAGANTHPLALGGRGWYHWTGVRGYSPSGDVLLLANPAPGYAGIDQTLTRDDWARLGPWSMVRLRHPAAEGLVPPFAPEPGPEPGPYPPLDYSEWIDGGKIGSGLLEMMQHDQTLPAQQYSTWLPLGRSPADIEEAYGQNGIRYVWLVSTVNRGFRYWPG
jgi:hypothetical protein